MRSSKPNEFAIDMISLRGFSGCNRIGQPQGAKVSSGIRSGGFADGVMLEPVNAFGNNGFYPDRFCAESCCKKIIRECVESLDGRLIRTVTHANKDEGDLAGGCLARS